MRQFLPREAGSPERQDAPKRVAIIGAGPSGLTAGYLLAKQGIPVTLFEADLHRVGGNMQTLEYHGCRLDTGGHRFYSDSSTVNRFWREILPDDLLMRPRTSRILHRGRFFSSPLRPLEALSKLAAPEAIRCFGSWLAAIAHPVKEPQQYDEWVRNRFGERLYSHFFKSYAEKTWGIDCSEIPAEWAERRLLGCALKTALWNLAVPTPDGRRIIKRPSQAFLYPRQGVGMMWEACAEKFRGLGGQLEMGAKVTGCAFNAKDRLWRMRLRREGEPESLIEVEHLISSIPMGELVRMLKPGPSEEAFRAASSLHYRDLLLVALRVKGGKRFHDNWLYVHDPRAKVARIQNYQASSPGMVSADGTICYGMEYFSSYGDNLWVSRDETLVEMAERELVLLRLVSQGEVLDGVVVRQRRAFPIHDNESDHHAALIREEIDRCYPTLHLVGRSGMHQCGHGDHPIKTAMESVDQILAFRPERKPKRPGSKGATVLPVI